jgi:hypothetical protein
MEHLTKNPEVQFYLEKIRQHLPELKHQLSLLSTIAQHQQALQLNGVIANELHLMPNDLRPEKVHLLYSFLHRLENAK